MYSAGIGELYPRRGVVPAKKYRIELTTEEQQELKALVSKGRAAAYKQTHARILLPGRSGPCTHPVAER